ncbi:hypothetical protein CRG98_018746 [Punica granatum]|uniref:Uncharacterized protein n=1 Tax=Punica granatum TaxID=22663 RepID=A0A2I0JYI4_PUNGR|nr:hypothetical protein CRG98_018746 [Punica granatum]
MRRENGVAVDRIEKRGPVPVGNGQCKASEPLLLLFSTPGRGWRKSNDASNRNHHHHSRWLLFWDRFILLRSSDASPLPMSGFQFQCVGGFDEFEVSFIATEREREREGERGSSEEDRGEEERLSLPFVAFARGDIVVRY